MNPPDWAATDYAAGWEHILHHEEEIRTSPLLDAGNGLTVVVPRGLPACKVHWTGGFMLAPLVVFMVTVAVFPVLGFSTRWEAGPVPVGITLGCLLLFLGLAGVLQLMVKNRDLFPRYYFVTLGTRGVAMHFSRFHFPWKDPRTALSWRDVVSVERTRLLFPPALLVGRLLLPALRVVGPNRETVEIPFPPFPESVPACDQAEQAIHQRIRSR